MEVQSRGRARGAARQADATERRDRAAFRLTTQLDDPIARPRGLTGVTNPVAVGADQIAFRRFLDQPSETSAERSDAKFLRRGVAMVELERFSTGRVAAVDASTSVGGDQRSEEHTSELQSRGHLVCRLLLEKK